jgi:hypothetical protein
MAAAKSATRQRASRSSGTERQRQRAHHADIAREKATARRKRREGAAGWVADRAGEWSLDGPDWDFFERQKYFWNPLVDYWFRMEVEGWENLPDPPALLVGIHSGAPFVWDAWTVGVHWWRWFGRERPLHGTAHDALMALPGSARTFAAWACSRPRPTASLPRSPPDGTSPCGPAGSGARCGRGADATRRCSLAARGSCAWRFAAACRSSRSRRSAAPTRCPCSPAVAGWRRCCNSTGSRN